MDTLIYSCIAAAASIVGSLLVMRWQEWSIRNSHAVNSLAAGVIIGVAFLRLMPEAVAMEPGAHVFLFVLAGFLTLYLIETVAVFHGGVEMHYHDGHDHVHGSRAWTVFSGLFAHSLIDGLVIGVGFEVSHELGVIATASVTLHKLPEGAATYALLISRVKRKTAFLLSTGVALAAPAGALAGMVVFRGMPASAMGDLLGLAAGSFIYIGASDLVPETHTSKSKINAIFLIVGALLAYLLSHLVHGH